MNRLTSLPGILLLAAVQQILAPAFIGTPGTNPLGQGAPTPAQPASWAFAIWAPIYLGALGFAVWQAFGAGARDAAVARVRTPLTLLYFGSTAWLIAAASSAKWLTIPIVLAMLALALVAMLRLARPPAPLSRATKLVAGWPAALYAGWLSAAAFVNIAAIGPKYLPALAVPGPVGLALPLVSAAAALAVAVLIAARGALAYALAVVWALVGIMFANRQGPVYWTAAAAALALLLTLLVIRRRRARLPA